MTGRALVLFRHRGVRLGVIFLVLLAAGMAWRNWQRFPQSAFSGTWMGTRHKLEIDMNTDTLVVDGVQTAIIDSIRVRDSLSLMCRRELGADNFAVYLYVIRLKRWDRATILGEELEYDVYRDEFAPTWFDSLTGNVPPD